jgi:hypothetical protein
MMDEMQFALGFISSPYHKLIVLWQCRCRLRDQQGTPKSVFNLLAHIVTDGTLV